MIERKIYVKPVLLFCGFVKNKGWLGLYNKKLSCLCLIGSFKGFGKIFAIF